MARKHGTLNPVVWVGLAEVEQQPGAGHLLDRNHAYVNVLALAATPEEFRSVVRTYFAEHGFSLLTLENEEPLVHRLEHSSVSDELMLLGEEVSSGLGPRWGTFHTWTAED